VIELAKVEAMVPVRPVRLFDSATRGAMPPGMASAAQLEAFRELRTRLLLLADAVRRRHFTTLVVPLGLGSGASFVARNLAAAFTLQEDWVAVLVDCDFRNPTQHTVLNAPPDGEGLSDYLDHRMHPETDQLVLVKRLIVPTGVRGLHLIPAGRCEAILAGRPREYFSSSAMRSLMAQLAAERCFVFLDGPPLVGSPDARILSELADFVLLVAGYGQNTPASIAQAAGMFDRSKFVGVVFNEVEATTKAKARNRRHKR
jgi:Mrp family chromosome partitioning ATPase